MHPLGGGLTARGVRGDDEHLVTGAAEMLDHPKHRVGDAVDIREEALCDDRNAHTRRVPAPPVRKVACREYDTRRAGRPAVRVLAAEGRAPWVCADVLGGDWRWCLTAGCTTARSTGTAQPDPLKPRRRGRPRTASASSPDSTTRPRDRDLHRAAVQPLRRPAGRLRRPDSPTTSQTGQLAVTYRPLTFLDDEYGTGYSGQVANALFLARRSRRRRRPSRSSVRRGTVGQPGSRRRGTHRRRDAPTWPATAGVPDDVGAAIAAGDPAVDIAEMDGHQLRVPLRDRPGRHRHPDGLRPQRANEKLDIYDNDWLSS